MFKVIIDIVGLKSTILVTVFYLLHLFFVSPPTLLLLPSLVSVFFFGCIGSSLLCVGFL